MAFAYAWHFFKVSSLTTYFNILLYVKNKRIILVFFSLGNLRPTMSMAYIGSRAKWRTAVETTKYFWMLSFQESIHFIVKSELNY